MSGPPKRWPTRKRLLSWAVYVVEGLVGNLLAIAQVGFIDLTKQDLTLLREIYEKNKEFADRLRVRLK